MEQTKKVIPTIRQKKAAKAVVENQVSKHPKPIGQVLESVAYGTGLQHNPNRVLESQGFKQALRDLGLTEELITTALVDDINDKPKNRLGELRLGAELLGITKPENEQPKSVVNNYNLIWKPEIQAKIKEIDDELKQQLSNAETD